MALKAAEILISKEQIAERVRAIADEISEKYSGETILMIGILRGAAMFLCDLSRCIDPSVNVTLEFMKASSYGASTVSSGDVTISQTPTLPVEGRHVIIVEDIVDTGLTLKRLCEYFSGQGAESVEVCVLLDKRERRVAEVPVKYSGFVIPDRFVVGYGMDYDEKMRNLPDIHIVRDFPEE